MLNDVSDTVLVSYIDTKSEPQYEWYSSIDTAMLRVAYLLRTGYVTDVHVRRAPTKATHCLIYTTVHGVTETKLFKSRMAAKYEINRLVERELLNDESECTICELSEELR